MHYSEDSGRKWSCIWARAIYFYLFESRVFSIPYLAGGDRPPPSPTNRFFQRDSTIMEKMSYDNVQGLFTLP